MVDGHDTTIPLHTEDITHTRRRSTTAVVRVAIILDERDHAIAEQLVSERAEITHVPVGRYVDTMPQVRQDGDVTIIPLVDEEVVIYRRLLLREEVHVRRVSLPRQFTKTVKLRTQQAVVSRTLPEDLKPE